MRGHGWKEEEMREATEGFPEERERRVQRRMARKETRMARMDEIGLTVVRVRTRAEELENEHWRLLVWVVE